MKASEIAARIQGSIGKAVEVSQPEALLPSITVEVDAAEEALRFCRDDNELAFDFLECLTAADTGQDIQLIFHLYSTTHRHRFNIKFLVVRHQARFPSSCGIWRAAHYYELEAAELLGIEFTGHPDPKNLLLPKDWHGHPLRKDYVFPEEYHALEHRREPMRKEHVRP